MSAILQWSDLVAYFGHDIDVHRKTLSKASQATHGVLACRSAPSDAANLTSRDGDHAERRLLQSDLWVKEVDAALAVWDERKDPMLILLGLNRAPCADCAQLLAAALHALNDKYPLRCERQYFVLASLGYYQGARFMNGTPAPNSTSVPSQAVTTGRGLDALRDAGWKLCVFDFGHGLTRRGQELLEYLQRPH